MSLHPSQETLLAIDPGTVDTGIAFFERSKLKAAWLYSADPRLSWTKRCPYLAQEIGTLKLTYHYRHAICEMPANFLDRQDVISSGATLKLAYLVGCIAQVIFHQDISFTLIPVRTWKGQLPKQVVMSRIVRAFAPPVGKYRDHEADAVGMGLAAQGGL